MREQGASVERIHDRKVRVERWCREKGDEARDIREEILGKRERERERERNEKYENHLEIHRESWEWQRWTLKNRCRSEYLCVYTDIFMQMQDHFYDIVPIHLMNPHFCFSLLFSLIQMMPWFVLVDLSCMYSIFFLCVGVDPKSSRDRWFYTPLTNLY